VILNTTAYQSSFEPGLLAAALELRAERAFRVPTLVGQCLAEQTRRRYTALPGYSEHPRDGGFDARLACIVGWTVWLPTEIECVATRESDVASLLTPPPGLRQHALA
jgi:hypothetical protein